MSKSEKLRVLHVKASLPYDGAAIIEYRLAVELKDEIAFDWFIISDEIGAYEDRFKALGSRIFHCSQFTREYGTKLPVITFYKFLKKCHYEIVYFDTDFAGRSYWALWARFAGIPRRIIHSHNTLTDGGVNPILHSFFKKLMLFSVTDYIACSKDAALWMFPERKAESAVIIKNGIDTKLFAYNPKRRQELRYKLGINDSCYVIGHVGRFSEQKNHKKLIGIFNEFQKIVSDSKLILVGDGELFIPIRQLVDNLNLTDKVIFTGMIDDVSSYLSAMDIFVFPSLFEGLGISAIEAECSGLLTYISDTVPDEAVATEYTKKINLEKNNTEWANIIVNDVHMLKCDRKEAAVAVKNAGFDIKDAASILSTILLKR